MSFEFTGAWVLKYCLDYLLPDIDVNEIYQEKEKIKKIYSDFISENIIDLIACAQSKDFDMLENILGDLMGKFNKDHIQSFVRKSVQLC